MTNSKQTKKALYSSVVSLLLCFVMLIGTTFAWFTDTASTSVNKIEAGTLDIELLDADGKTSLEGKTLAWQKAEGHEKEAVLWEPGATYNLQPVTIRNNGNLALKYKVVITGIEGDAELNKAIDWTIKVGENTYSADTAHKLAVGASEKLTISGTMKTTAGNQYKGLSIDGIAITVLATQDTVEYDSNNKTYDSAAAYDDVNIVSTAAELAEKLTANEASINVTLASDITMDIASLGTITGGSGQYKLGGLNTTAINIDLNGHKLTLNTTYWSALGANNNNAVITVKNGSMNSSQTTGTWNSYDLTFYDCKWNFENVTFDKAVAIATGADTTMNNVIINESNSEAAAYALWITADGQTVTLNNVTIQSKGGKDTRAIAIKDQYRENASKKVTFNIKDCKFSSASKAAVLVTSKAGAVINASNVDINGVTADTTNLVWVDNATDYSNIKDVNVAGATAIVEP